MLKFLPTGESQYIKELSCIRAWFNICVVASNCPRDFMNIKRMNYQVIHRKTHYILIKEICAISQ